MNSELDASKWHIWLKMLIFGPIEAKNVPGDTPVKMEKNMEMTENCQNGLILTHKVGH